MVNRRDKVSYFYDAEVPFNYYGTEHPMKPARLRLAHHLVLNYGLHRLMNVYRPHTATLQEMAVYHSHEYLECMQRASVSSSKVSQEELAKFGLGQDDCPVMEDLYDFCARYSGGSIDGAVHLNHQRCEVAVNWSGGLHHAKKAESSGFCYVNDIVLAIQELLKFHARVLYIDIDIHHGDGVEDAFWLTDRVMTLSLHKFSENFFPGSGDVDEIGAQEGKYYTVNFPLKDGITDDAYMSVFQPIIKKIMHIYKPGAVVLQCGADSLTQDQLGTFNLTVKGHGDCVKYVKSFGLPMLVLGGGGYTIRNVARCWAYETAVVLDKEEEIPNAIPPHEYREYYANGGAGGTGPGSSGSYELHLQPLPDRRNKNTREYLEKYRNIIFSNLSKIKGAPSVQFTHVPPEGALQEAILAAKREETGGRGGERRGGGERRSS